MNFSAMESTQITNVLTVLVLATLSGWLMRRQPESRTDHQTVTLPPFWQRRGLWRAAVAALALEFLLSGLAPEFTRLSTVDRLAAGIFSIMLPIIAGEALAWALLARRNRVDAAFGSHGTVHSSVRTLPVFLDFLGPGVSLFVFLSVMPAVAALISGGPESPRLADMAWLLTWLASLPMLALYLAALMSLVNERIHTAEPLTRLTRFDWLGRAFAFDRSEVKAITGFLNIFCPGVVLHVEQDAKKPVKVKIHAWMSGAEALVRVLYGNIPKNRWTAEALALVQPLLHTLQLEPGGGLRFTDLERNRQRKFQPEEITSVALDEDEQRLTLTLPDREELPLFLISLEENARLREMLLQLDADRVWRPGDREKARQLLD